MDVADDASQFLVLTVIFILDTMKTQSRFALEINSEMMDSCSTTIRLIIRCRIDN